MNDDRLISLNAAIELVRDVCDAIMSGCESWYDPETKDEVYEDIREVNAILKCNKEVRIALRNLPSAKPKEDIRAMCGECDAWNQYKNYPQPRWIPCSERLPEYDAPALLSTAWGKTEIGWWTQRGWVIVPASYRELKQDAVVAWMPLPEPYRGDEK